MRSTALLCVFSAIPLAAIACVSVDDRTLTSAGTTGAGTGGTNTGGATNTGGRDAGNDVSAGGGGSSTGGAAGSGGNTGGSAGSGGTCALPASPGYELYDDFESGNGWVAQINGRSGRWAAVWGVGDGAVGYLDVGLAVVKPARVTSGDFVLHWAGAGYTWGNLSSYLVAPNPSLAPYDLSRYVGIRFSAKSGTGPDSLRIAIPSKQTASGNNGGTCKGNGCDDNYNKLVPISMVWQSFSIPFCEMRQQGIGAAVALDLHNIFSIAFAPKDLGAAFDFSVDDIELILPTGTDAGPTDAGPDAGAATSIIDNMEDGDGQLLAPMTGGWFLFEDGASDAGMTPAGPVTMSNITPARDQSTKALHVTAIGDVGTSAGFGVNLNVVGGLPNAYDASAWDGIQFWMKGADGKGTAFPIAIELPTVETMPSTSGGACDVDGSVNCYNVAVAYRKVDASWTLVTVPFASLGPKWGQARSVDAKKLLQITFSANDSTASGGFDVWVDDLAFYKAK